LMVVCALVLLAVATAFVLTRDGADPVKPVRHATTPAQQARNLTDWLTEYSR
jgi:hypothetical protein